MDPLSDVLSLLKPQSYMVGGFEAGGEWSVAFPERRGIKVYAVVFGECWLAVEGTADAVRLKTGDCFLLPRGKPFRLASDLGLPSVDGMTVIAAQRTSGVASLNGGRDCFGVGGHFAFASPHAEILLGALPAIVHVRKEADKAALRWSMERMRQELDDPQPGGFLIAEHLAHMILLQALRAYLAEGPKGGVGWLFALADKRIGAALSAMHENPARRWTLHELAAQAQMSRTSFAEKFKEKAGTPPLEYLTRWRMLIAGDRLTNSRDSVSAIALSLGYESESAFSTAFKRVMGSSPRQFSRAAQPAPHPYGDTRAAGVRRLETVAG
jgi:AraC-like DNA-binding protein